jgi:uncharacterized coiled-coil protein SlyX
MTDASTELKIITIEVMMAELTASVAQTTRNVDRFSIGMADFKDEMKDFKNEMADFKDEMREETKKLNKQLGEIANKQGRMAEDLVEPSVGRILRQVEHYPESMPAAVTVRLRLIHPTDPSRFRKFDTIAMCGEHLLINETKSTLEPKDVKKVLSLIPDVREYLPQYHDKKIICSLATLYVDPSLVKYATKQGILVLAVGDELMDVMNPPGFKPKEY